MVDHYRRQETETQTLEGFGQEQEGAVDPELHAQVCGICATHGCLDCRCRQ